MAPRWSSEELAFLDQHAGETPFFILLAHVQKRWPHRTERGLREKLWQLGFSTQVGDSEWLCIASAARILRITKDRAYRILGNQEAHKILQPRRNTADRVCYVTRSRWRRLARKMPQLFGGISSDCLFALIEDRDLADQIAQQFPGNGRDFRVKCRETGQSWPSCVHAARSLHVDASTIYHAIRRKRAVQVLGMTFEWQRSRSYLET